MTDWLCLDCAFIGDLDVHGRCPRCGSASLCVAAPGAALEKLLADRKEVEELERMVKL